MNKPLTTYAGRPIEAVVDYHPVTREFTAELSFPGTKHLKEPIEAELVFADKAGLLDELRGLARDLVHVFDPQVLTQTIWRRITNR